MRYSRLYVAQSSFGIGHAIDQKGLMVECVRLLRWDDATLTLASACTDKAYDCVSPLYASPPSTAYVSTTISNKEPDSIDISHDKWVL